MSKLHDLAFILPAKNEERFIVKVLTSLCEAFPHAYVCVVVNGSTDQTVSLSRQTLENVSPKGGGFCIVELSHEGKGRAIRSGLENCRANYYILLDADGQHDPAESRKLIEKAQSGDYGMVIGSRYLHRSGHMQNARSRGNRIFNFFFRMLYPEKVTDVLSGFRLLNGKFASQLQLKSRHFEIEVELFLEARRLGWPVAEVPVREIRMAKANKLNLFKDGLKIFTFTLKKRLQYGWRYNKAK